MGCIVVAGVSGSGKTTFAKALAAALGWPYVEGDDFHPASNVAKMAAGQPLTDEDREPWLEAIGHRIEEAGPTSGLVITCSALRREYRRRLVANRPWVAFCLVQAPPAVLDERLRHRAGHYMPASLLDSQLATLEPLGQDEPGITLDSTPARTTMLESAISQLVPRAAGSKLGGP